MKKIVLVLSGDEEVLQMYGGATIIRAKQLTGAPVKGPLDQALPDDFVIVVHEELIPANNVIDRQTFEFIVAHEQGHIYFNHQPILDNLRAAGAYDPDVACQMEVEADMYAADYYGPKSVRESILRLSAYLSKRIGVPETGDVLQLRCKALSELEKTYGPNGRIPLRSKSFANQFLQQT